MKFELEISLISALAAVVAALGAWRSAAIAKRALAITERDHLEKHESVRANLIDGVSWQNDKGEHFVSFACSYLNSANAPNSIAKVDLIVEAYDGTGMLSKAILDPYVQDVPSMWNLKKLPIPLNLETRSTVSGWITFKLPKQLVTNRRIEKYQVISMTTSGERAVVEISISNVVPIVADGAIAHSDWGDGRLIPVLVVNCGNHPALRDLINIHADTPPGDVTATWSRHLLNRKCVYLRLDFQRPVETSTLFSFEVSRKGYVADWIMNVHAVYIQPTDSGLKVSEGIDKPKILVEVSATATLPGWQEIYQRSLTKEFQSKGYSKGQAKQATVQYLARTRDLWRKGIATNQIED
jgi:hypothetical protein